VGRRFRAEVNKPEAMKLAATLVGERINDGLLADQGWREDFHLTEENGDKVAASLVKLSQEMERRSS